jgi:hypothetical protein
MRYLHIRNVTAKAHFETEDDLLFRYRLAITKDRASPSPKTACVVMQNPSYAGEEIADKSVQFMEKNVFERGLPEFAGVERLVVVNQFARVQTTDFRGLPSDIGSKNDLAIETALTESEIIIIGWGSANPFKTRQDFVLDLLAKLPNKCVYKTSSHPSRGKYAGFIQPFDIQLGAQVD